MNADGPIVMVVDDERDFLLLTKKVLERHGYRVDARTRAPSWRELLQLDPAVILMDVMLEGENGSDVCRAIKSHKRLADLPVILVSGHGEDRLRKEVDRCNANGYLTKPISSALLLQLAEHFVQRHVRASKLLTVRTNPSAGHGTSGPSPHPGPTSPSQNDTEHAIGGQAMRARADEGPGTKE